MSTPSGVGNFFERSSNLQITNSQLFALSVQSPGAQEINLEHLHILDAEVATNAILNSGGRVDIPKCHPGTREEVISRTEKWMTVGYRNDRHIFWLSGPAGAGKSAIVQTLAENCLDRGIPMANFFFFRADGSRNHARPFVATLLRQLMKLLPELRALVNGIIAQDTLIFKTSLREQFMTLIDAPIRKLRTAMSDAPPIVLLIDGLDECDSRAELDNATTSEQRTILDVLSERVKSPDSQFIVLVASRAESHIVMAFNNIGRYKDSIYLNKDYRPDEDITLYITEELDRIRRTHALGQLLETTWPFDSSIKCIVEKSSGQFIYASTVVRFIAQSPESPALTIEMVLNVRPPLNGSPFAEIDAIYMFILSRSKHWDHASEIIALDAMLESDSSYPSVSSSPSSLGYSVHEAASFFPDLGSIIQAEISERSVKLTFYHASFHDFIYNPKRAGKFHINMTNYANSLAPRLIPVISDFDTFIVATEVLKKVNQRSEPLTDALIHLPAKPLDVHWNGRVFDVQHNFLALLKNLYVVHDPDLYTQILDHMRQQGWIPDNVFLSNTLSPSASKPRSVFSTIRWMWPR